MIGQLFQFRLVYNGHILGSVYVELKIREKLFVFSGDLGRANDPLAVLDSHLRVRDGQGGHVAGLRVVDAGAMPTITSGNTNSPTLMMAEKAAAWIRAGR